DRYLLPLDGVLDVLQRGAARDQSRLHERALVSRRHRSLEAGGPARAADAVVASPLRRIRFGVLSIGRELEQPEVAAVATEIEGVRRAEDDLPIVLDGRRCRIEAARDG